MEDAAEGYIKGNDFLMLLLMPERIDTNWVGDEAFEASLVKQAKRLSEKVQDVVSDMDRGSVRLSTGPSLNLPIPGTPSPGRRIT